MSSNYVINSNYIQKQHRDLQNALAIYAKPIVQHKGQMEFASHLRILNVYIKNHFRQDEIIHELVWMVSSHGIFNTCETASRFFQACLIYYFERENEFHETRYDYLEFITT